MWKPVPLSLRVWHLLFPLGRGLRAGFVPRPVPCGPSCSDELPSSVSDAPRFTGPVPPCRCRGGVQAARADRVRALVGRRPAAAGLPKRRLPGRWCSRQGDGSRSPQGVGVLCTRRHTPVPWTKPLRGDQGEIRRREARVQRGVSIPRLGRPIQSRASLAEPARWSGRPSSGPDEAKVGVEVGPGGPVWHAGARA
jgi:hypothetical protein